jgi:Protein of unknown function (DUF2559)
MGALISYNLRARNRKVQDMEKLSLEAKKAWFAKHRKANYAASLRLEGFCASKDDGEIKLPTRAAALKAVRLVKA